MDLHGQVVIQPCGGGPHQTVLPRGAVDRGHIREKRLARLWILNGGRAERSECLLNSSQRREAEGGTESNHERGECKVPGARVIQQVSVKIRPIKAIGSNTTLPATPTKASKTAALRSASSPMGVGRQWRRGVH